MPNEYSVEIHDFLSQKLKELEDKKTEGKEENRDFINGKVNEVKWLRKYLKDHIDLKNYTYY